MARYGDKAELWLGTQKRTMRDLPLTNQLKTVLADPVCAEWMPVNVKHGASPAFGDDGLCFRFEDDPEAERFCERWLSGGL